MVNKDVYNICRPWLCPGHRRGSTERCPDHLGGGERLAASSPARTQLSLSALPVSPTRTQFFSDAARVIVRREFMSKVGMNVTESV